MARPREFDQDKVLKALKDVFWENGYEGTSYSDIIKVTGLQKGSLYAAFGDKRSLYQHALAKYDSDELSAGIKMLRDESRSGLKRLTMLMQSVVDNAETEQGRWGCLLCNAAIDQAPFDKGVEGSVTASMNRFREAIEFALKDLPSYSRAPKVRKSKAAALLSGYFGLRVLLKAGMPKTALQMAAKDYLRL